MPPNVRTRSMTAGAGLLATQPAGVVAARGVPARCGRGGRAGRARGGGQSAAASRSGSFGLLSGARTPLDSPPRSFSAGSTFSSSSFSPSLPGSPGSFWSGSGGDGSCGWGMLERTDELEKNVNGGFRDGIMARQRSLTIEPDIDVFHDALPPPSGSMPPPPQRHIPPPPPPVPGSHLCPSARYLLPTLPNTTSPNELLHAEIGWYQDISGERQMENLLYHFGAEVADERCRLSYRLRDAAVKLHKEVIKARDAAVLKMEVDRQVQRHLVREYCAGKRPKARTRLGKWLDRVVDWWEREEGDW